MNKYFEIPKNCPVCGHPTIIKTEFLSSVLYCQNPQCSGLLVNKLDHFCGKKGLDIKGLSEATLEKLVEWGWVKSCVDIFKLTPEEYGIRWAEKPGFGVKSVANILNAIQESRNCKLDKFIAALGIPLIGTKASKDLAGRFKSWAEFIKAISTNFKFYELPNFGIEMHNAIMGFDYAEALELATNYLDITSVEPETAEASLEGKTFVITGKLNKYKNRDELKSIIESLGGKVSGSISSKTHYLINNDVNSTSSKNTAAKKLNIPIISEEDFCKMFGI